MRLTAELINKSLSYTNPLNERELDLRGHKIPGVENLGVAKGGQECIDFTDNDISTLGNFPLLPRLYSLLCARNRITTISPTLPNSAPHLSTLVLTQNNISELSDLDPLQGFAKLTHLSLVGNPVARKEHYRYWVIWRCPKVRFLDFQKVKDAERQQAKELFGSSAQPTDLARGILATRSNKAMSFGNAPTVNGTGKGTNVKITDEERKRFQMMVQKAGSLQEVQKLEKLYNEGRIPSESMEGVEMDET